MTSAAHITGILLAAGSSSRFGGDKLLHPMKDGLPMVLVTARHLRQACEPAVAVVRPGSDRLAALLEGAGCEVVASPETIGGMGHSLAAGVCAAPRAEGWVVALADMPFIAASTYQCIAEALRSGSSIAAPCHKGHRGHPVGFASHWFERLSRLEGDEGARAILAAFPGDIRLCEVEDEGIWRDVNRRADLEPGQVVETLLTARRLV
jgi:molybdenum cofactor cytidylyltransferase